MTNTFYYEVAKQLIRISYLQSDNSDACLLPSFAPFAVDEAQCASNLFFSLDVDDGLRPRKDGQLVRNFDTGNGFTEVRMLSDGGYQFIIDNVEGRHCCLLITDKGFKQSTCALRGSNIDRRFGLNNALMLIFAFAGASRGLMLIHASCVEHHNRGYAFIAKSGTGKSTHSGMWLSAISDTLLLNDDNPIVRIDDQGIWLCGSPWSGKTPCYRSREVLLGAVVRIERAPANSIEREKPVGAFASLLPSCSSMKWDKLIYNHLCDNVTRVVEGVPVFTIYCLPDEDAARLCHRTVTANN